MEGMLASAVKSVFSCQDRALLLFTNMALSEVLVKYSLKVQIPHNCAHDMWLSQLQPLLNKLVTLLGRNMHRAVEPLFQ